MRRFAQSTQDMLSEYLELSKILWNGNVPEENKSVQNENKSIYQLPINGRVISHHAPGNPTPTHPNGHTGIDLSGKRGDPIYPIGPGIVTETGVDPKGGNYVKTEHDKGRVKAYYAHLDSILVQKGQFVSSTTAIGTVGDSGNAKGRGPHLHYQVSVDNTQIDPLKLKASHDSVNTNRTKIIPILKRGSSK